MGRKAAWALSTVACLLAAGAPPAVRADVAGASASPAPSPAAARPVAAKPAPCSFGAFVKETDPAGLNVRAAPRVAAVIVGRLPPVVFSRELAGYPVKVEVDVLAAERGWFQITHARDNTALTGQPARRMFAGRGWVSGVQLTAKSQARQGHTGPSHESAMALRLKDGGSFDGDAFVNAAQLVDCRGPWAQLELSERRLPADVLDLLVVSPAARSGLPPGRVRAWFLEICGNQETSCDGTASQQAPPQPSPPPQPPKPGR